MQEVLKQALKELSAGAVSDPGLVRCNLEDAVRDLVERASAAAAAAGESVVAAATTAGGGLGGSVGGAASTEGSAAAAAQISQLVHDVVQRYNAEIEALRCAVQRTAAAPLAVLAGYPAPECSTAAGHPAFPQCWQQTGVGAVAPAALAALEAAKLPLPLPHITPSGSTAAASSSSTVAALVDAAVRENARALHAHLSSWASSGGGLHCWVLMEELQGSWVQLQEQQQHSLARLQQQQRRLPSPQQQLAAPPDSMLAVVPPPAPVGSVSGLMVAPSPVAASSQGGSSMTGAVSSGWAWRGAQRPLAGAAPITDRQRLHMPPALAAGGGSNHGGGQVLVTDKGAGAAAVSAGNARALDVLGQLRKLIGM